MLLLRRRDAALLRAGADDRHLLRHLLVGAGDGAAGDVDGRLARGPGQAREEARAPRARRSFPDRAGRCAPTRRAPQRRRPDADDAPLLAAGARPDARRRSPAQYGPWLYALLFLVIFAETGLVVFPFLPGDSLLFIAGTVVATAGLNVHVLVALLIVAAVARRLGQLLDRPLHRAEGLRQARLALVQAGAPAAHAGVLRQVRRRHDHHRPLRADRPHLRAVPRRRRRDDLPQVPLLQRDRRRRCGSASLVYAGYLFGNIPWVKNNLSLIVVGIVVVSLIPVGIDVAARARRGRKR